MAIVHVLILGWNLFVISFLEFMGTYLFSYLTGLEAKLP